MSTENFGAWASPGGLIDIAAALKSLARARVSLRGAERGRRIRCYGKLEIQRTGTIRIGERVTFLAGPVATSLRCSRGAELEIGDRTICNYGAALIAKHGVRIGRDCMIASQVHICDDDGRRSGPIAIGDGVWIAHGAVIEPGAVIGDGSVIGALAVVSGVVPRRSLVVGNPAQFVAIEPTLEGPARAAPADGAPSSTEVRSAVIEWLDDTRCFGDAGERVTSDTMSLRDAGLLDSLGLVQLVTSLEKRFGRTIDRKRVARPELQSVRGLLECMAPAGGGPNAP